MRAMSLRESLQIIEGAFVRAAELKLKPLTIVVFVTVMILLPILWPLQAMP